MKMPVIKKYLFKIKEGKDVISEIQAQHKRCNGKILVIEETKK